MRIQLPTTLAVLLAAATADAPAQEHSFPARPVRLVSPFSAGSNNDTLARLIGPKLSDIWRQPLVVENRVGAGGTVGTAVVAKAAPDGHTLLMTGGSFVFSAVLHPNLAYDALKDFAGVTRIGFATGALVVTPALGVKSVKEFVALARDRNGKVLFGSAGAGSNMHLNVESFMQAAGVRGTHVGFKGASEVMIELIAGRVHFTVVGLGQALPFIKDGKLVALAVNLPQRSPLLPDVPAMSELLPAYDGQHEANVILAPVRTPHAVLNRVARDVAQILALPDVKERMSAMAFVAAPSTPAEVDRALRAQIEKATQVVRMAGLRPQ